MHFYSSFLSWLSLCICLCEWNCLVGQNITPLGEGLKIQGEISDIQYDAALNRIYVAGDFTAIDNVRASNLAYYENNAWHAIDGISGTVHAIALNGSDLYVGGYFEYAGDQKTWGIAKYSNSEWTSLGSGSNGSGSITDVAWFDGELYATGTFASMGYAQISGIAKWNGHGWTDEGLIGALRETKLLVTGDTLWSYGVRHEGTDGKTYVLTYKTSNQWNKIAKLDGSSMNNVQSLVMHNAVPYILATNERIYKWNGAIWSEEYDIDGGEFMYVFQDELYLVSQNNAAERLDLLRVSDLATIGTIPNGNRQYFIQTALEINDDLWLGGFFRAFNGVLSPSLLQWSDDVWTTPGKVASTGYLSSNSYAYGESVFADSMFVGGNFLFAGDVYAPHVARWKDNAWQPVGEGFNNVVKGFISFNNVVYAGGHFTKSGEHAVNYFAQWNGQSWSQVGLGTNAPVYGFIIFNNRLHVYGAFTQIDGKNIYNFARLNGATWEQVPGPWTAGDADEVIHVIQHNNNLIASTSDTYPIKILSNTTWEEMSPDFYLPEGHLGVFNGVVYYAVDGDGLYKHTGSEWQRVSEIIDIELSFWGRVFVLENELYASFQNIGFLKYESASYTNIHPAFRPLSFSKITDQQYLTTGFFNTIEKAGCNEGVLYNHVAIVDFEYPHFAIEIETPDPCIENYVYLDITTTLLDYTVTWEVEGSIFGVSELDCPILRYFEPGTYPITAIVEHALGSDTLHTTITIAADCLTSIVEVAPESSIQVWPNPSSDIVQFKHDSQLKAIVTVFDLSGHTVYSTELPAGADEHTISIVDWHEGYYLLVVKTDRSFHCTRFVKTTP